MIKLVITDMDGTLLDDQHRINPEFWSIEEKLSARGIIFAVASGRQYYNLVDVFDRIKNRTLFLSENGTFVMYQNQEIHVDCLNGEAACEFMLLGRKLTDAYVVVCGKNGAYIENTDSRFLAEASKYFKRLKTVDDLTQVDDQVLKVSVCDFGGAETNSYPHYKVFEKDYKVAVSAKIWLDITNLHANKGTAVRQIQEKMGISPNETLVFGDFLNDLEMMSTAYYSYAMKNAHPAIHKASNFVTDFDNNNNGVVATINKLCIENFS